MTEEKSEQMLAFFANEIDFEKKHLMFLRLTKYFKGFMNQ